MNMDIYVNTYFCLSTYVFLYLYVFLRGHCLRWTNANDVSTRMESIYKNICM